jgi:hypothetical protein
MRQRRILLALWLVLGTGSISHAAIDRIDLRVEGMT